MSDSELMSLFVYASSIGVIAFLLTVFSAFRAGSRRAYFSGLRDKAFGSESSDIFPAFENNREVYAVLSGSRLAVVDPEKTEDLVDVHQLTAVSILQDGSGAIGVELQSKAHKIVLSGLDALVRAYRHFSSVDFEMQFQLDQGEDRLNKRLSGLAPKELEIVKEWLVEQELILDVVADVKFKGKLGPGGTVNNSLLLVTNMRLGLLVQTTTVQQVGNAQRVTTHFNLLNYPLPLAECFQLVPDQAFRKHSYHGSLQYSAEQQAAKAPTLVLEQGHGSVLFPIAICRAKVKVLSRSPNPARLIAELLIGTVLFGMLGAIVIGGPYAAYWGMGSNSWMEDWIPVVFCGGAIAGAVIRGISTFENFLERRALAAMAG
jgi:hypothetical protein